jgi:hypothetical protein
MTRPTKKPKTPELPIPQKALTEIEELHSVLTALLIERRSLVALATLPEQQDSQEKLNRIDNVFVRVAHQLRGHGALKDLLEELATQRCTNSRSGQDAATLNIWGF